MGEEETLNKAFRFLTDVEFDALDTRGKALYLVQAQQQVETWQQSIRSHHERLNKELEDKLKR